ncbi:CdaR family transcriptional regulator [Bacillus sp. V59.32b]|uniref:PucR family transcriptional regulator n=1 Tax=Bacillus sp. V59.32b TaxID=1758642 RepID=UPI000E3C0AEF|nr:helix-turn-helix domain-containing protein [Bacillus sp. V59.32b]RFU64364.1 hypothetical protein D0463_10460 [Bacillus sp. V59.32b]
MLKNLKLKFPRAIDSDRSCSQPANYVWFQDENGNKLGIPKSDISTEETGLLQLLFPLSQDDAFNRNTTIQKKQWHDFLYKNTDVIPLTSWNRVTYTHFTISVHDFSHADFEEALLAFMTDGALIIWQSDLTGILIEGERNPNEDGSDFSAALNMLESDFYVKIRAYVGALHPVDKELPSHLRMEHKLFMTAKQYLPDMKATNLPAVFPYAVLAGIKENETDWFIRQLLQDTKQDEELITSVKMYIECNSNASLAAKQLYIHRNSLQYRIDKFIEKTGLDIRTFNHALTAYLIILLNKDNSLGRD